MVQNPPSVPSVFGAPHTMGVCNVSVGVGPRIQNDDKNKCIIVICHTLVVHYGRYIYSIVGKGTKAQVGGNSDSGWVT